MLNKVIYLLLAFFISLLVGVLYQESKSDKTQEAIQAEDAKQTSTEKKLVKKDSKPAIMPDFAAIQDTNQRKKAFVDFILPAIEEVNQQVLAEREFLLGLNLKSLSNADRARFELLAQKYREELTADNLAEVYQSLLVKVDEIAPALALAQAANESAWGTSRFARKGLNFYGQWCFSQGCGLVPSRRSAGQNHEVRVFASVKDSVEAYILNLNSFHTYDDLREIRAKLRKKNKPVTGVALAEGLLSYSERREAYIEELQQMIRFNRWE